MTQSRRKQAEAAVIAAAREWHAERNSLYGWAGVPAPAVVLEDAVRALNALDLTPVDNGSEGAYGFNSPDTSKSAAISVRATSSAVRRMILDELTGVYHTPARGLICQELEKRIHREHTTTSSQVNFLMNHGWIEDSGYRRNTRADRPAIVWRLSDAAFDQITNQGAP